MTVRLVPAPELAGEIDSDVDVVAFSAVQMATGEVADLESIAIAASEHDVMTVVDATQAVGWLPLDGSHFDVVVAHAYKWMMSPRGTAFMAIRPERLDAVVPHAAGWYGGEDPLATFFGAPLRLSTQRATARHVARMVHVGRNGARAGGDRADRRRLDQRARRRAREPVPGRPRARAERLRDRLLRRARRRREAGRGPGSRRQSAGAGCGRRGTSTTRRTTSSGRSTCSQTDARAEPPSYSPLRMSASRVGTNEISSKRAAQPGPRGDCTRKPARSSAPASRAKCRMSSQRLPSRDA